MTIQNAVSIIVSLAFVSVILILLFFPPKGDPSSYAILNTLIGVLAAAFGTVVQFHLGSSKGSEDKTETIKQLATGDGNIVRSP